MWGINKLAVLITRERNHSLIYYLHG